MRVKSWEEENYNLCVAGRYTHYNLIAFKTPDYLVLPHDLVLRGGIITVGDHIDQIGNENKSAAWTSIHICNPQTIKYVGSCEETWNNNPVVFRLFNICRDLKEVHHSRDLFGMIDLQYHDIYVAFMDFGEKDLCLLNLFGSIRIIETSQYNLVGSTSPGGL